MADEDEPRRRPTASLYWFATWNNYDEETLLRFLQDLEGKCERFCAQEEVGASGTPHIQCKIKLNSPGRPIETFGIPAIHWLKSSKWAGWQYCCKEDTRAGRRWAKGVELPIEVAVAEMYGWQLIARDKFTSEPEQRLIYWLWEPTGNFGKSAWVKYMVVKHKAALFGGKAEDAMFGIAQMKVKPSICIMDIPRCVEHVSYSAIEQIKNGCFFSPKYESGMCAFNSPHIVILSNHEPDLDKLSRDRWVVKNLRDPFFAL